MTLITFQGGAAVMRDGKVGTEQGCCCGGCCYEYGTAAFMYEGTYTAIDYIDAVPSITGYVKAQPTTAPIFSYAKIVECPVPADGSQAFLDAQQAFYDALIAALPAGMELYQEAPGNPGYWNFAFVSTDQPCGNVFP